MNGAAAPSSGIGRRRGAGAGGGRMKSSRISVIVVATSFLLTLVVILVSLGHMTLSSSSSSSSGSMDRTTSAVPGSAKRPRNNVPPAGAVAVAGDVSSDKKAEDALLDEEISKQFREWGGIIRADLHLVSIDTFAMVSAADSSSSSYAKDKGGSGSSNGGHINGNGGGGKYQGVQASFCKLDWSQYKEDPPSLPMFRFLVSASGCDKRKNIVTMDLATVVRKTREYDKLRAATRARANKNANANANGDAAAADDDDLHVMPPAGFVFHESRVGSTLVANALQAMDPDGHRVYSESDPINQALKACERVLSTCHIDANAELFRDVVYLMGRTSSPKERRMFFKVSSIGSKRIDVMREAFPTVPWIFVYRDPVQTMMSHLDPDKQQVGNKKTIRGGGDGKKPPLAPPKAVCLRLKSYPPEDLIQLAANFGRHFDTLSYEEFCAVHLATLCESAWNAMRKSEGHGAAVEYDGLAEKLIRAVIPDHFGVEVDDDARRRILDVSKIYSKSKTTTRKDDNKDKAWVEDSDAKEERSTPEIRDASKMFLSESYYKLGQFDIK